MLGCREAVVGWEDFVTAAEFWELLALLCVDFAVMDDFCDSTGCCMERVLGVPLVLRSGEGALSDTTDLEDRNDF